MKKLAAAVALGLSLALSSCSGGASPAGDYTMDVAAFAEAMMAKMGGDKMKEMPADAKTKMLEGMKKDMSGMLSLKADNTWTMETKMSMMGQTNNTKVTGTWKLEGEKLTMTGKEEGGKEETATGTFKNGKIALTRDGLTMNFVPKAK